MTKQAAEQLAKELARRAAGSAFYVVRVTRFDGRKTIHVIRRGGIRRLIDRLSADRAEIIAAYDSPLNAERQSDTRD